MDKQYLREKLDAMRQNFVESTHHERAVGVLDQAHMSKKMLKIKKKLVALETVSYTHLTLPTSA